MSADKTKLDRIRDRAIDLVADAIDDDDIPAAKRADMALSLLGKAAIKDREEVQDADQPWEMWFRRLEPDGTITDAFGYLCCPPGWQDGEHSDPS